MKKLFLQVALLAAVVFGFSGCAQHGAIPSDVSKLPAYEKNGFLASKWCVENGYFSECRYESYVCGYGECWKDYEYGDEKVLELALYVQSERDYYNVVLGEELMVHELEELAFNRNDVTLKGHFHEPSKTIIVSSFDAPPPPEGEFYKGCL